MTGLILERRTNCLAWNLLKVSVPLIDETEDFRLSVYEW